jgi:hypothetical protein
MSVGEMKDIIVYHDTIKRELKRRLYKYRCDERLKTKNEKSTRPQTLGWSWNWNT